VYISRLSASKPIAVMLFSSLIARKVYTLQKYLLVLIVVFGVIMFSFKEQYETRDGEDPVLGISLIGASLIVDGVAGAIQDRMRSVSKPTSLNLMLYSNTWSSLYLAALLALTGEGLKFINFCMHFPYVMLDIGAVVIVGSIGQFFVSSMISNFGALPLSLVMTVRKCLQVFASVLIFNNRLSLRQWIAAACVFLALIFDAIFQTSPNASESESTQYTDTESESGGENKEEFLCDEKKVNLMHVVIECDHEGAQKKIENLNENLIEKIQ
jgi:solute carrier family 35 (UDP-galactose transporter), member B1